MHNTPNFHVVRPLLFVNQSVGPLFSSLVSLFRQHFHLHLFTGISYRNKSFLSRMFTWGIFTLHLFFFLLFCGHRFHKLLIVSNPPFAPLLATFARRPYVLLLYDLYPHVLYQFNTKKPLLRFFLSILINIWHSFNSRVFSRADRVFTLTDSMADQLRPYFASEALWHDRVVVVPPWSDTDIISSNPSASSEFRLKYGVEGLLLTYSGNLGLTHPLEELLEATSQLCALSSPPCFHVLIIGDGQKRLRLQKQALSLDLPLFNLRFLDRLPFNELAASLSAADFAIVALDESASFASLPSKAFNALACGTPLLVLANFHSSIAQLVRKYHCGVVIEPDCNARRRLVETIIYFSSNPSELHQLSSNAISASFHFTSKNAERFLDSW